jgi:hypothetical protein
MNYGLQEFKDIVLNEWQNVLFYDNTIQIDHLSSRSKKGATRVFKPNYWTGLLQTIKLKLYLS